MPQTKRPANMVGPEIRRRRYKMRLTQEEFAAQCQLKGLDISRATVSQIEAQLRRVSDYELLLVASVLKTSTDSLFP